MLRNDATLVLLTTQKTQQARVPRRSQAIHHLHDAGRINENVCCHRYRHRHARQSFLHELDPVGRSAPPKPSIASKL